MLRGLMQDDFQLTLQYVLRRMRSLPAAGEVVIVMGIPGAGKSRAAATIEFRIDLILSGLDLVRNYVGMDVQQVGKQV